MKRVKRRIFSGAVCEQEVYWIPDGAEVKTSEPKERFKDDEARAAHREGISRRRHARLINTNFRSGDIYSTLTFDNESEVHTFEEARRLRNNFVRRLKRIRPDAVIFIYMGRGKHTNRIHMHMISAGITEGDIKGKWIYGEVVRLSPLKAHNYYEGVDHGQDFSGLANYLFDHWTPEQGGHRWKQTRNARQPEKETPVQALRAYTEDKPPLPPKGYRLVETQKTPYGYLYFKYVADGTRPKEYFKKRE